MLTNFKMVIEEAKKLGPVTVAVAAAQDREVLEAIKDANKLGLIKAILIGDENLIQPIFDELGLENCATIIHEQDMDKAALKAAETVHIGDAQILMKGLINSSNFLRAALDKEIGLRSGKILSHFAAFEIPGEKKLAFHSDGGMNIAPSLEEKKQ